jgi:hypothetical protein
MPDFIYTFLIKKELRISIISKNRFNAEHRARQFYDKCGLAVRLLGKRRIGGYKKAGYGKLWGKTCGHDVRKKR